jgi:hypothetical protein
MNHGERRELQLVSAEAGPAWGTILNCRPYTVGIDEPTTIRAELGRLREGWFRTGMTGLSIIDIPARKIFNGKRRAEKQT